MSDRDKVSNSFSSDSTDSPLYGTNAANNTTYDTYDPDATTDYGVRAAKPLRTYNKMATDVNTSEHDTASGAKVKRTTFENGRSRTIYSPETGAYEETLDYTEKGVQHHHREKLSSEGVYQSRDVELEKDGTRHVRREYKNPITGTSTSLRGTMSDRAFEMDF
ncbi:hypothetical protein BDV23DRAFT_182522 [Aspergillus alliaceus]|uniref:Uncharacterized protein n=1 Tax=Petromyces alliaceus TaxID=209559 RepID=A0A5N7CC74_PETAA|nr:hypothetical protein BDV23DRAFT_182522 [Aspergillus alliaceus]